MLGRINARIAPLLAASMSLAGVALTASADISEQIFVIQATNRVGTATHIVHAADGEWINPTDFQWTLPGEADMRDADGNTVATLREGSLLLREDPEVTLNFSVSAGSLDTVFTITSAMVSFAAMGSAAGQVSAGITATDLEGDGVYLAPGNQDGMYVSNYNGFVPGGTIFQSLFSSPISQPTPFDSISISSDFPGGGAFVPIPGTVSNISARFSFSLSPNDIASGTSIFTVVPAPASLVALAGTLAFGNARRRR